VSVGAQGGDGEVPQKKDPYWWMHPAYRGQQALDMETLDAMPSGGYRWVSFDAAEEDEVDPKLMQDPSGYFVEFSKLLYKVNGFKPGPVSNWYVIICVEADTRWAVGQLCADPNTPVQIFDDRLFDSEDAARRCAETMRAGAIPGAAS